MDENEIEDQTPQHEGEPNDRRRRYLLTGSTYRSIVEEQIQEAFERGDFDDLPGKGKPLIIESNPYAGDRELAYKLLKDNNFTLPWIAQRNDVLDAIELLRAQQQRQWQLIGPQIGALIDAGQLAVAQRRWTALTIQWELAIEKLNKRIDDINLLMPAPVLQILKLNLEAELIRLGANPNLNRR